MSTKEPLHRPTWGDLVIASLFAYFLGAVTTLFLI